MAIIDNSSDVKRLNGDGEWRKIALNFHVLELGEEFRKPHVERRLLDAVATGCVLRCNISPARGSDLGTPRVSEHGLANSIPFHGMVVQRKHLLLVISVRINH